MKFIRNKTVLSVIERRIFSGGKNQKFTEVDVGADPANFREMLERSRGRKTVPEIFIEGKLIGGFDELQDLANSGKLDELFDLGKKPDEIRTNLEFLIDSAKALGVLPNILA